MKNKKKYIYISEIFFSIQGEGPFLGLPCLFIRFSFCNLKCYFCDTRNKLNKRKKIKMGNILSIIKNYKHITITGGEPFYQKKELFYILKKIHNKTIIIETNGSIFLSKKELDILKKKKINLIISPKKEIEKAIAYWNKIKDKYKINIFFKFLIINRKSMCFYKNIIKKYNLNNIYFQPLDIHKDYNKNVRKLLQEFLEEFRQYPKKLYFRPQIHKFLNIK